MQAGAVPATTSPSVARDRLGDQPRAVRLALVRQQPRASLARQRGQEGGLPSGSRAQVQPAFVAARRPAPGERERHEL